MFGGCVCRFSVGQSIGICPGQDQGLSALVGHGLHLQAGIQASDFGPNSQTVFLWGLNPWVEVVEGLFSVHSCEYWNYHDRNFAMIRPLVGGLDLHDINTEEGVTKT